MASVRLHLALAAAIAGVLVYVYCIHREIKKLDVHINSLVASVKTLQSRLNEKDSASGQVVVNLPQSPLLVSDNGQPSPAQLMEMMLGVGGLNENDAKRHGTPGGFVLEEEEDDEDDNDDIDNDMSTFIANEHADDTEEEEEEDDDDDDVASSSISSGEVKDMMDKLDGLHDDDENADDGAPEIADEVLVLADGPSDASSSSTGLESQNQSDLGGSPCMVESPDIIAIPESDEVEVQVDVPLDVEVEQESKQATTYAEYKLKSYKIDELKNILRNEFGVEPPKGTKEVLVKAILDAQGAAH